MRQALRPFLLVTLVSFLLGLWLSLRHAEKELLNRLRELPQITVLTDQPTWWSAVAQKARREGVGDLLLLSIPRREWNETLNTANAGCDLVTTKSYFLRHFQSSHWLEKSPQMSAWRELLHPDFRDLNESTTTNQFLPLLWSVTSWQGVSSSEKRLELKTSLDEALLVAIDMRVADAEEFSGEQIDNHEAAEQLWNNSKDQFTLAIDQPDSFIPIEPIKAVQKFITESREDSASTVDPRLRHDDLWTWGLGTCPGHAQRSDVKDFVHWLLEPENSALLAQDSGLALTLMSGDHARESGRRPSNLRGFNLERLRRRELSWDLSAAWEDLFRAAAR